MFNFRISLKEARELMVEICGNRLTKAILILVVLGVAAWSVVQIDLLRERVPGIAAFIEKSWAGVVGTRNVPVSIEICGGQIRTINEGRVLAKVPDHWKSPNYWKYSRTVRVETSSADLFGIRFEARARSNEADTKIFDVLREGGGKSPFDDYGQLTPEGIYFFIHKPTDFLKLIVVAHKPDLVDITPEFKCEEDVSR